MRPRSSNVTMYGQQQQNKVLLDEGLFLSKSIDIKKAAKEEQQSSGQYLAANHNETMIGILKNTHNKIALSHAAPGNESDRLNRSIDSVALSVLSLKPPMKNQINLNSASTLKSIGPTTEQLQRLQRKTTHIPALPIVSNQTQILHQDMGGYGKRPKEPLNDKGNAIKGRKIDSPHLVVVKEIREFEEQDESAHQAAAPRSGINHRENHHNNQRSQSKNRDYPKRPARSVENINRRNKSKDRLPQAPLIQNSKPPIQKSEEKPSKAQITRIKEQVIKHQKIQGIKINQRSSSKGTKSSRDIRTTMGFNELLNQLDKEVTMQQSHQNVDFKNRTTHEILQVELQDNKDLNLKKQTQPDRLQTSKSRSRERKLNAVVNQVSMAHIVQSLQAIMPKSMLSKQQTSIERGNYRKSSGSHNITDATPDKNQFLQSEHGRCVTAQTIHQSQSILQQNGKNNSHQQLNTSLGFAGNPKNKSQSKNKTSQYFLNENVYKMKDQSSPDRSGCQTSQYMERGIDWLVKQNIKKNKNKVEEEKLQRQVSEERLKQKREMLEQNNNMVRLINKEKTYKKQIVQNIQANQVALDNQQSQDFVGQDYPGLNPKIKIGKFMNIKNINVMKLSQSQKIDFQKIQEATKVNRNQLNVSKNQHRKSYGLEFIEIKKQIQEELKTLERDNFKQRNQDFNENTNPSIDSHNQNSSSDLGLNALSNYYRQDQLHIPKRLNIKQTKNQYNKHENTNMTIGTGSSLLDISIGNNNGPSQNKTERGGNDESCDLHSAPVHKIVVIKKSKIRKFMKMKKKEKQKEIILQHKDQILKTIKMQENITKLNDFCKKNLMKQVHKRRNATIQHPNNQSLRGIEEERSQINQSKISGRKIFFDKVQKKQVQPQIENEDDSSRLSTEFYEEYYRLLNSLKKDDQMPVHEIEQSTMFAQQSRAVVMKSPTSKSVINPNQTTLIVSPKDGEKIKMLGKISKSQLSNNQNNPRSKSKTKKQQIKQYDHRQLEQFLQAQMMVAKSKKTNKSKSKERAESAPLLNKKLQILKNTKAMMQSQKKFAQGSKHLDLQEDKAMTDTEIELLSIYVNNQASKIQRAYRQHLQRQSSLYHDSSNSTVQHQQPESISSNKFSEKQASQNIYQNDQETVRRDEQQPHDNSYEYDEEEEDDRELIIINDHMIQDDKKVVYLSNINSCSFPQTPKIDQSEQAVSQFQEEPKVIQNTRFEYVQKIGQNLEQISPNDFQYNNYYSKSSEDSQFDGELQMIVHQEISQKPTSETPSLGSKKQQESVIHMIDSREEIKQSEENLIRDYGMRIFAGSESMLRELKMSTPKEHKNIGFKELQSTGGGASKRMLTSHNSQSSLIQEHLLQERQTFTNPHNMIDNTYHVQPLQGNHSQTHTSQSQSSQSLFERNSFQQFTANKLQTMIKNNEYMHLIQMREKALDYRQEKERKYIKKMYKTRQFSPRTYTDKKLQLEKWVHLEQEEIQKSKKQFQEEWDKTVNMIEETQKNVDIMREQIRVHTHLPDQTHVRHQWNNAPKNDLQSSRNSSASYATTSHKQDRKSILEQEEYQPLSHRSNRMNTFQSLYADTKNVEQFKMTNPPESSKIQQMPTQIQVPQLTAETLNGNLIDFLEDSWKKSQTNVVQLSNTMHQRTAGILIEDQNNQYPKIISPQIQSEKKPSSYEQSEFASKKESESAQQLTIIHPEEERPLMRSRSEQDLTDLLKKSRLDFEDQNNPSQYDDEGQQEDSFRILDSERQNQNSQIYFGKPINDDIKIQENLYDDSSQRQMSSYQQAFYPQTIIQDDLQSHDSLLNEAELNNHFKGGAENKFSIEDFKQLDKRKLFNTEDVEIHTGREIIFNQDSAANLDIIDTEQIGLQFEQQNIDLCAVQAPQYLFQNAKPGENIKISDMLKKNTSSLYSMNPYEDNNKISLIVSQPIADRVFNDIDTLPKTHNFQNEKESIANEIAENLLQMLIDSEVVIPNHFVLRNNKMMDDNELQIQPIQITDHPLIHHGPVDIPAIPENNNHINQDVYLVDTSMNEKESRRELIDFKQRMLIESDLQKIENYINEVIVMLQQHELNFLEGISTGQIIMSDQNYHRMFLQVLTIPIKRNQLDVLNQLQTSEIGSYEHYETTMDISAHPILPVDLYLDIERQREEQQLMRVVDLENSVLQESVHIHNKALFDSLNESLMKFRPYGMQGEPMPWSNKVRRLQTSVDTNQVDTERLFFMVKQDVMRWAQNSVGCLPSQVFVIRRPINDPMALIPQSQEHFDEEIFQETRERRLAQMLASEVVETEHQWLNYEFEESQVKIDLSDMILEQLVEELVVFMNQNKYNQ